MAQAPQCDTGKGLVALDGVMGTAMAVASLTLLADDEGSGAAITGLIGAAFVAAAVHGNSTVNECRGAMIAYHRGEAPALPDDARQTLVASKPHLPVTPPAPEPAEISGDPYEPPPAEVRVAPPPPPLPVKPAAPAKPAPKPAAPAPVLDDWKAFWIEVPQ